MSQPKIKLPVRPRSYRFAMTPLADAMFQLLIFFMLTSSLTPYSLLTVQTAAEAPTEVTPPGGDTSQPPQQQPAPARDIAFWTLEADKLIIQGQDFEFDQLEGLAEALGSDIAPAEVILIVRDTARVQDVTTVLAHLSSANVSSVRVAGEPE